MNAAAAVVDSLLERVNQEQRRFTSLLERARGHDAMSARELEELFIDAMLAQGRLLELVAELAKRSLPR